MAVGFNGTMLAIFTTLAPAGAVAFALLGLVALVCMVGGGSLLGEGGLARLNHAMALPLLVVWVGFISAATHLGMPSNALFVIDGIGRSPLSNEVAATVGFLFFSGVFWLYSFKLEPRGWVLSALLVAAMGFAVALVLMSAGAYDIATVITWNTWHEAVGLECNALLGGAMLAAGILVLLGCERVRGFVFALLVLAAAALVGGTIVAWMQWEWLQGVGNYAMSAVAAVPGYPVAILARAALGLLGIGLLIPHGAKVLPSLQVLVACAAVFAGILLLRLPFYDMILHAGF